MAYAAVIRMDPNGFKCYGQNRTFFYDKSPEIMLSGPYETGKTMTWVNKMHLLCCKYPGTQALMVRQTYKSLIASVVPTYEKKVLPVPPDHPDSAVAKFGKSKPEWYDYPNDSRIYLGGMDSPDKFLSAEFDLIGVPQAEEITLDGWEKLMGRATGRAGNMPYAQIMGDCNPGPPHHWIVNRASLKLYKSRHEDNPALYDPETGQQTEQGRRTLAALDNLTGIRYKRGRLGQWAGAEGQVYENYDTTIHLIDRFEIPASWRRYRSIDFGYRNPFVCQWWAVDEDDRLYRYREIYMSGRTVREHAEQINAYSEGESYIATVADHDAEDRATLREHGIYTVAARKDVRLGIERTQERFQVQGDGRPRIFFLRDSLIEPDTERQIQYKTICTEDEILNYVFPDTKQGKNEDENPVKVDDHGQDAMRYMVMEVDKGGVTVLDYNPFFG